MVTMSKLARLRASGIMAGTIPGAITGQVAAFEAV